MSRIRFDQLAKQYLEEFLEPLGTVQRNLEVPGESKFVDVWFVPNPEASVSTQDLGLLSRIAKTPCLLEPFSTAPTRQDVRSCLLKLLWIQEEQRRRLEQAEETQTESTLPQLWILAATTTRPVIAEFGGQQRRDWMPGIYFASEMYKSAIVALDELPTTQETLWLRILGRGETQAQAISEVLALPKDDPQRSSVLQLLVNWKVSVELIGNLEPEEAGLMATLSQAYLEWEQRTEQRGIEQGIEQGIERGERSLVLRLLTRRVGGIPEALRSPLNNLSLEQLEALGEALLDFRTIADLESWLQAYQEE